MCKEKVAERSCSDDSRRGIVKKHQWIIVHNGSAYQGLPVLAAFTTESPPVPDSLLSATSNSIQPLMFSWHEANSQFFFFWPRFFLSGASFGLVPFWKCIIWVKEEFVSVPRTKREVSTTCVDIDWSPTHDWRWKVTTEQPTSKSFSQQVQLEKIVSCDKGSVWAVSLQ